MWRVLIALATLASEARADRDCNRPFDPADYLAQLPSLALPYVSSVPIRPSPVALTKVVDVVTRVVYKNPVCVKVAGKKPACRPLGPKAELVTKEYFVRDGRNDEEDDLGPYLRSSEAPRPFSAQRRTPGLSAEEVKELLIEDRLDQLESVLPHYTRRRVFQTSTVTVTKVRSNNRATATLLVKNCVPAGYDLCPKARQRKSKIAKAGNATEKHYFG